MKIPLRCIGEICHIADCNNQAMHKVGEENIWNEKSEQAQYERFSRFHNLTTYLCEEHFNLVMGK